MTSYVVSIPSGVGGFIPKQGGRDMTTKVYWKALRLVLGESKRYIQRWEIQLQANLTAPQYACVVAVLDAIIECLQLLPANEPE